LRKTLLKKSVKGGGYSGLSYMVGVKDVHVDENNPSVPERG
jgi:hypothetical protein